MRELVVAELAGAIASVEASLEPSTIHQVIDRLVAKEPQGRRLQAALNEDPGLLTAASPKTPTGLARILLALVQAGAQTVRAPACGDCGRERPLPSRVGGSAICGMCARERAAVTVRCHRCHEHAKRNRSVAGRDFCRTCWQALQPTAAERIARFTASHVPGGDKTVAAAAVEQLGLKADRKLRLALECDYLGAQWLVEASPASSLFTAFYDALRAEGAQLPQRRCGHCGRTGKLTSRLEGLTCCRKCYRAGHLAACDGCGKTASLELRRPDGSRLCQACTNRLDESWADCVGCNNRRLIAYRAPHGPMCWRCRAVPVPDVCTRCGTEAECRFQGTDRATCLACYAAARMDTCTRCGSRGECKFAATDKAICLPCDRRPEPCSLCARLTVPRARDADGAPICWACVPQNIERCINCALPKRVNARTTVGPLCLSCSTNSPLMHRDCKRCGTRARLHLRKWCSRCYADDKLYRLLPDELIAARPALARLRERCLAADARRTLRAFRRNTTTAKLALALSRTDTLSHELLDSLGSLDEVAPVRSLLVENELLPPRDEHLVRFERWCAETAAGITDAAHRRAFERFARWRPLRQLREQDRPVTPGQTSGRRDELRQVLSLLAWLTDRSESITQLDQARLDLWLSTGTTRRVRTAAFLRWAARNQLCPRLRVPPQRKSTLTPTGSSVEERWELLERLLHERAIDPRTRLAGVLVLLYGTRVVQLRRLRVTDITGEAGRVAIRLGADPLDLHGAIGELAVVARGHREAPRLLSDAGEDDWLFPGQYHGTSISTDALTDRLNAVGVRVRAARTGAVVSLVQELPAPVVARLTGLSTATSWAQAVAVSDGRYAARTGLFDDGGP